MSEPAAALTVVPADFAVRWLSTRNTLLVSAAAVTAVENDAALDDAGRIEARIKKSLKELETERKAFTAPIDEVKKQIMAKEKSLAAPLKTELDRIHAMTVAYATECNRRVEAERRAREAAEAAAAEAQAAAEETDPFGFNGPVPAPAVPPPAPAPQMPRTSSNRFVEKWDFTVVDERAVPRELLSVDERKVRAFLAARKAEGYKADQVSVPGLRISATVQVYSR